MLYIKFKSIDSLKILKFLAILLSISACLYIIGYDIRLREEEAKYKQNNIQMCLPDHFSKTEIVAIGLDRTTCLDKNGVAKYIFIEK